MVSLVLLTCYGSIEAFPLCLTYIFRKSTDVDPYGCKNGHLHPQLNGGAELVTVYSAALL